jgi:CheY-like chemotaxis protein
VTDAEQDMRRYLTGLLTRYCDVTQCTDGRRAWELLRTKEYDLVLSDDMMPVWGVIEPEVIVAECKQNMSGTELLEAIRGSPAHQFMPFIMISAAAGDEARLDTLARGADGAYFTVYAIQPSRLRSRRHTDYLCKPFKVRELLLRVHMQLQASAARNSLEQKMFKNSRDLEKSQQSFVRL